MGRDYLKTVGERVVVFDGGMGATLEQFDLTQEDYGGLQGKCHEALVLNRPDVIENLHASMIEAGAEVVEMEAAALLAVADRRGVAAAVALAVTDLLGGGERSRIEREELESIGVRLGEAGWAAFAAVAT